MLLLYTFALRIYYFIAWLTVPFHLKSKQWIKGQQAAKKNLRSQAAKKRHSNCIWIHCASLGEFEQGRPVIEKIKKEQKDTIIILTFFSPSGYEIRRTYPQADVVMYLPLDSRHNAQKFLNFYQPTHIIIIKYEFWYYYLNEANKRGIPTYLLSAKFRPDQLFFKPYGAWFLRILNDFTCLFVQDADSAALLHRYQPKLPVIINGDTRFDRVSTIANHALPIEKVRQFTQGKQTIIAGSTWPEDEQLLTHYINQAPPDIKFVIAPHEISASGLRHLEVSLKCKTLRYSDQTEPAGDESVLLIDTIGILSSCYQYGTLAYIGGGFGKGIHNILEAATFGLPVVFGPHHKKFNEAMELIKAGAAFPITNQSSLNQLFDQFMHKRSMITHAGQTARDYVRQHTGATQNAYHKIFNPENNTSTISHSTS